MISFSPYELKPLPKAGPRKNNGKVRKGRKGNIAQKTKKDTRITKDTDNNSDGEDCFCLVCFEFFANNRSN